jgi:hypothetical protein
MGRQHGLPQDLPTPGELDLAHPIGEEPIMPDTLEAPRKDMQEKPPKEFDGVECHGALPIAALVVFPSKRDMAICAGQQAPIGDGHTMRVARQVVEYRLGACEWRLGVDHPLGLGQRRKPLAPGLGYCQRLARALHAEGALRGGLAERSEEGAAEKTTEDAYRQEEALGAGDPRRAIYRQPTCRNQAMEMGMMTTTLTIP